MGFHTGSHAPVWEIRPQSDNRTLVRLSTSRKNKSTDQYEQDFSGFVSFVGTANASKAAKLQERDWIVLGDTDVQSRFDKEQNREFVYYTCFGFEIQENNRRNNGGGRVGFEPASNEPAGNEPRGGRTPF